MFANARLKLTSWYLLILAIIVLLFSATIYRLVDLELARVARAQRMRVERWRIMLPPSANFSQINFLDETEIEEVRRRILLMLTAVDISVIFVAGVLGYFLAGKTLSPIEKMVREQERFVADSSHELRTPLTSLRTSMEVALRDKSITSKVAKEVIAENLKEVIRLQSLAESLLELSRSGKKLALSVCEVLTIIKNAVTQVEKIAKENRIGIEVAKKTAKIRANEMALERVLVIVLDNAIKYSDKGSVVKVVTKQKKGLTHIMIIDQGKGIKSEQIGRVFERFFRGDKARSSRTPGYGLGLSIAKELMEAQGGKIEIESEEGVGTKVDLILPSSG